MALGAVLLGLQEPERLALCVPPGEASVSDCRWESVNLSAIVPELGHPCSYNLCSWTPLKSETEALPTFPCWLGLSPFPVLPPQSLPGSSWEHFLFQLLKLKSCLAVCFQRTWVKYMIRCCNSSWSFNDYKTKCLLNILDTLQCFLFETCVISFNPQSDPL